MKRRDQGALHEMMEREHAVKAPSERRFGLTFAGACSVIGIISVWRHGGHVGYWLGVGALFAIVSVARPTLLSPVNRIWLKLGLLLHTVASPVIMAVIFYAVFTPTAVIMRLVGKDPLRLRRDPEARSYWILRNPPGPEPASLKNQF